MYESIAETSSNNGPGNNSINEKVIPTQKFQYNDDIIEVVIIENSEDDRDGYVELSSAAKLLAPITNIRNFTKSLLWTNVLPSQKLTRNSKNYIHVFALGKYLSSYMFTNKTHPPQYYVLKQLFCDLLLGAQSQVVDPLNDIKNQLCSLQECINGSNSSAMSLYQPPNSGLTPTTSSSINSNINYEVIEALREIIQNEFSMFYTNVNNVLENVKNSQTELTKKIAFSNDTVVDTFKSIKDIIIRKK
ncbi:P24 [Chrysodeixis includens nucleopolyhedrovirus]|uniref:P24 n=1 Tax=Chrysodeixis includens nucleopolyhedrovirus TaxID=1207438 RepID=A0A5B8YTS5_9ABAC|nr:P24 [Chrysodeixis includens nucleopolyhedrovirus]QED40638.1 P24 [Chrysodeixis includens nucleopolyhedrovirus]